MATDVQRGGEAEPDGPRNNTAEDKTNAERPPRSKHNTERAQETARPPKTGEPERK